MIKLLEVLLITGGTILVISLGLLVISAPFAFLGWLIMVFIGVFGVTVSITYFNAVIVGLVSAIIIGLFN